MTQMDVARTSGRSRERGGSNRHSVVRLRSDLPKNVRSTPPLDDATRRSVTLLSGMLRGTRDHVTIKDLDSRFIFVNEAALDWFGLPVEQLLGRTNAELCGQGEAAESAARDRACIESGQPVQLEEVLVRDGTTRTWLTTKDVIRNESGEIIALSAISREITDRVQAQAALARADEALRRSMALLNGIIEGTNDHIHVKDLEGRYLLANRSDAAWFGLPLEEIIGRTDVELLGAAAAARFGQLDREVIESGLPMTYEQESTLDGVTRTWLTSKDVIRDDVGQVTGVYAISREITDQKRAEEKLRASEANLRAFFDSPGVMRSIVEVRDGHAVHVLDNAEANAFFDHTQSWQARPAAGLGIPGKEEQLYLAKYAESRHAGQSVRFDYPLETPSGIRRFEAVVSHVGIAPNGHPRYAATVNDVTDRMLAETTIRQSQHDLAEAQRIGGLGSWTFDPTSGASTWSPQMYRIFGIDRSGQPADMATLAKLFTPEALERVAAALERAVRTGEPLKVDVEFTRPDGTPGWVAVDGEAERNATGTAFRLRGTMLDITARVLAEATRTRLVSAIEQSADAISVGQIDGPIEFVNAGFERLYGYQRDEVLGQNLRILKSGRHTRAFWEMIWEVIRAGGTWSGMLVNRRKDGTLVEVESVMSGFLDPGGQPVGLVKTDRDVTQERALQARLRQASQMEAIGQLAGGVAHDFNNMLTAIRGYTELVREHLPVADEQDRADLGQVLLAADRATALTRQLLAFGRKQMLEPRVLDPDVIVSEIVPMLRRLLGAQVALTTRSAPDVGLIRVDPSQLEQVIVNLAVNARDAMPAGGALTIETANADLDEAYVARHPSAIAGPHVMLAVADTGTGMDAATLARIFEPFFTTKGSGQGTGLGLATVYGIVQQSGGSIEVDSEPGQGTTFRVYFPRLIGESSVAVTQPAATTLPTGSETILLVEDEPAIRALARRTLSDLGYNVLEAGNGTTALGVAAACTRAIDLLVTDLIMPGMHGVELAEQLSVAQPSMRTLLVSGFADDSVIRHGVVERDHAFLPKPFSGEALAQTVRDVLDRAARR